MQALQRLLVLAGTLLHLWHILEAAAAFAVVSLRCFTICQYLDSLLALFNRIIYNIMLLNQFKIKSEINPSFKVNSVHDYQVVKLRLDLFLEP